MIIRRDVSVDERPAFEGSVESINYKDHEKVVIGARRQSAGSALAREPGIGVELVMSPTELDRLTEAWQQVRACGAGTTRDIRRTMGREEYAATVASLKKGDSLHVDPRRLGEYLRIAEEISEHDPELAAQVVTMVESVRVLQVTATKRKDP